MDEQKTIEEAVKGRLSLIKHWTDEHNGLRMMLMVMDLADFTGTPRTDLTPNQVETARRLSSLVRDDMVTGGLFVAPADVCQLISGIWETYPSTTAYATDIIAPSGMVYFEKPLDDPDPHAYSIRAISWLVRPSDDPAIGFYDGADDPDTHMLVLIVYIDRRDVGHLFTDPENLPRLMPVASVVWQIGVEGGGQFWDGVDPEFATNMRSPYVQILLSYFRIISQELLELGEPQTRNKRNDIRIKAAKRKHPNLSGKIAITRFRPQTGSGRKQQQGDKTSSGREFSVRFYRRPFWRWQYYPSTGENKPRLIITKKLIGPEGAPIVGVERVFLPPKPLRDRPSKQ